MDDLLSVDEFLRRAKREGIELTRRGLQLYFSPRYRLLPKPVYKGGHVAYMPAELLKRLRLIRALQNTYRLNLSQVGDVLDMVEENVFPYFLSGDVPPRFFKIILGREYRESRRKNFPTERITLAGLKMHLQGTVERIKTVPENAG